VPVISPSHERHSWTACFPSLFMSEVGERDIFRAYTFWMTSPHLILPLPEDLSSPPTQALCRKKNSAFFLIIFTLVFYIALFFFLSLGLSSFVSHQRAGLRHVSQLFVTMVQLLFSMERVLWLLQFGGVAVLVVMTIELHDLTDVAFWNIIVVLLSKIKV